MHLDLKNKRCPIPIVEISKVMKTLEVGQIITVEANDPVFKADVEAWCRKTKNKLLDVSEENDVTSVKLEKV